MKPTRVLIVEPSRIFQQLVARALEGEGAVCVTAATAAEGLQRLDAEEYAMVCVAATLPDGNGIDFTSQARGRNHLNHVPVVLLTAGLDLATDARALRAGVTLVVQRNEIRQLATFIEKIIRESRAQLSGRALLLWAPHGAGLETAGVLRTAGLEVDSHHSATKALEALGAIEYDLALTGGLVDSDAFMREVRLLTSAQRRVPVLVILDEADPARRVELLRAGANDLVVVPVVPEEIVLRAANLLATKQLLDRVEAQQSHLKTLALTDPLTSLHNRHFLAETAQMCLSEARRHEFPVSLMVIDIDHFKKINDTHGHAQGDRVLVEVAGVIKRSCRREDIAARFGGEEFVLVLPRCEEKDAVHKADRIRMAVADLRPAGLDVTVSIGVTTLPIGRTASLERLFSAADGALYEAKEGGRNRVVLSAWNASGSP